MRQSLFIFFLLAVSFRASAEQRLTLADALRLASDHSHRLASASADSEAADHARRAALAGRLPTLSLSAYSSYKSEVPSLEIGFPPPISYSLSRTMGSKETYQADLQLSLPLYTGGRIGSAIRQAEAGLRYREAAARIETDNLYLRTHLAYMSLARTDGLVAAAEASLRRALVIQEDVEAMYAAGTADSVDLLEVRLAAIEASLGVQEAGRARRSAEIELAVLLGIPSEETLTVADSLRSPHATVDDSRSNTIADKPELAAADANVALQEARVAAAQARRWPTLAGFVGYSIGKPNQDFFHDEWNDFYSAGVNLSWSFGPGNRTAADVRSHRRTLEAAGRQRDQAEEDLSREALLSYEQLHLATERCRVSEERNLIAKDNFRLANAQHKEGALSANRLLEIEAALTQSEAMLASDVADYYMVLSKYYYAVGSEKLTEGL